MRKNVNGKRILMTAVVGAMLCGMTGCGGSSAPVAATKEESFADSAAAGATADEGFASYNGDYNDATYDDVAMEMDSSDAKTDAASDSDLAENSRYAASNKKIIKRYNYSYETEKFDEAYQYLKEQVSKYNGYVSNSEMNGRDRRNLYFEARIPADKSDEFVSKLGNLGTVTSQSESAEDVTLQYADTEGRIASLKTEQERLLSLMEKADKLENIITLENRLTEVRYQLESFESQKKVYDDLVTYSTITINLSEVRYTVEVDETSLVSRVITGFKKSLRDVGYDAVNTVADFIIALPHIIVFLIKLFIIFLIGRGIIRLVIKKIKKKKEKKMNAATIMTGQQNAEAQKAVVTENAEQTKETKKNK